MKKIGSVILAICIIVTNIAGVVANETEIDNCVSCVSLSTEILSAGKITDYTLVKTEFINALKSELFRDVIKEEFTYIYERASIHYVETKEGETILVIIPYSDSKGVKLGSVIYMKNEGDNEALISQYVDFDSGERFIYAKGDRINGIVEESQFLEVPSINTRSTCITDCEYYMALGCAAGCLYFGGWAPACEYICGIAAEHTCDCYCNELNCYGQPSAPDCGTIGKPDCEKWE